MRPRFVRDCVRQRQSYEKRSSRSRSVISGPYFAAIRAADDHERVMGETIPAFMQNCSLFVLAVNARRLADPELASCCSCRSGGRAVCRGELDAPKKSRGRLGAARGATPVQPKGCAAHAFEDSFDVTLQDVEALCDNRVIEGRFLDFKADKIGSADRDKREFLADVTASPTPPAATSFWASEPRMARLTISAAST